MNTPRQPNRSGDGLPPQKRIKRAHISIPLATRPKDYVPGSGPPLQPVELLPQSDSTAYIVERILLPPAGIAKDGKPLPKRMSYIVGWRDLPAARLLVPVMDILDYVSPYELEEWEYNMELELEHDRAKLEQEKRELQRRPAEAPSKTKPKARPPAHSNIEAAAVAEAESDAHAKERPKKGAMSLSTPQKTKMDAFTELSDDYDEYESPSEQIARESTSMGTDIRVRPERHNLTVSDSESQLQPKGRPEISVFGKWDASLSESPAVRVRWSSQDHSKPQLLDVASQLRSEYRTRNHQWVDTLLAVRATSAPANNRIVVRQSPTKATPAAGSGKAPKGAQLARTAQEEPSALSEDPNNDWEVERIEDLELYNVEGKGLVRYFKVRWAGDWPPEENPTWEPEENLPPVLIRGFLKSYNAKQKAKQRARPTDKSVTPINADTDTRPRSFVQSTLSWPLATALAPVRATVPETAHDIIKKSNRPNAGENSERDDMMETESSEESRDESSSDEQGEPQSTHSEAQQSAAHSKMAHWKMESNYGVRMAFPNGM